MNEEKELAVLRKLVEATRKGKVTWEPLVAPGSSRFLASLPNGTVFVLSAPATQPPAGPVIGVFAPRLPLNLEIRDRADRVVASIGATYGDIPGLGPSQDLRAETVAQLFPLVTAQAERPLDETLEELEQLTSR